MSWHSIYAQAERDHRSTVIVVNFVQKSPCSSVSTVDFENKFIFWVWPFNISIIFRLRRIQAVFIYRNNFLEVKYLHEVACAALVFFKISKLEWVKTTFSNTIYILFRVTFQDKSSLSLVRVGISWGHLSGGSFSGRNYSGKNVRRQKSKGHLPWEYFMRVNCQGVIIQEENI